MNRGLFVEYFRGKPAQPRPGLWPSPDPGWSRSVPSDSGVSVLKI